MKQLGINYNAILPETIAACFGILIMMLDAIVQGLKSRVASAVALGGLILSAGATIGLWYGVHRNGPYESFSQTLVTDELRLFFSLIFILVGILTVLISINWVEEESLSGAEYFSLLMFATTGMMVMSAANDLVMVFLGLEITSLSTYVLCGYRRDDTRSTESALKYFILGSVSTAFLLYGIALVYGASYLPGANPVATTNLRLLGERISSGTIFSEALLLAGAAMIIVGLGFKVASAPFHIWSPDVYQGAPTPVTSLLAAGSKAAAFSVFARIIIFTFVVVSIAGSAANHLGAATKTTLAVIALLSMIVGNFTAIVQNDVKRMLAYSSIAHAGYILLGLVAVDWKAVAFYVLSYVIINIGAFTVVQVIARRGDIHTNISEYAGIGFRSQTLALLLSLFLLSLAGLPLTAGFMGKLIIFKSAWAAGYKWLVVVAVINSAISWYYYLRVVVVMYFQEPSTLFEAPRIAKPLAVALLIMLAANIYLGILPNRVLGVLEHTRPLVSLRAP